MPSAILFYDGECSLCHWAVKWVLKYDSAGTWRYAPLQGSTAKAMLVRAPYSNATLARPDTLLVAYEGQVYSRANAVRLLVNQVSAPWIVEQLVNLPPLWLLDLGYRFVAKVRYAVFGKSAQSCPVVPAPLRSRFLP
jgi:predicted DCC family thiol-disulfide oxidoreductase YuxK